VREGGKEGGREKGETGRGKRENGRGGRDIGREIVTFSSSLKRVVVVTILIVGTKGKFVILPFPVMK
jgi:hypothetical protein